MATLVKRGDRWRAQVRRLGQPTLSKTFAGRADAAAWARDIEHKINRGQSVVISCTQLAADGGFGARVATAGSM